MKLVLEQTKVDITVNKTEHKLKMRYLSNKANT